MQEDLQERIVDVSFNKPAEPETTVHANLCLYHKGSEPLYQQANEFCEKNSI